MLCGWRWRSGGGEERGITLENPARAVIVYRVNIFETSVAERAMLYTRTRLEGLGYDRVRAGSVAFAIERFYDDAVLGVLSEGR